MKLTSCFYNTAPTVLRLRVEPWGELYDIGPFGSARVTFASDLAGEPEIDFSSGEMVVYGWEGCAVEVAIREGAAGPRAVEPLPVGQSHN